MKHNLALFLLGVGSMPWFAASGAQQQVAATTTERVSFAPGGVIRLLNSFDTLNVEGWDRPEVEITVTKSTGRFYDPDRREHAAAGLERVHIVTERRSDSELAISTILPPRLFTRWWGGKGGFLKGTGATLDKVTGTVRHPKGGNGGPSLEYQVHVPRDSRLVIHHGEGRVLVSNVTGDIEATSRGGDILLMLPESGAYSIDARSRLGTVASDFEGEAHRHHLVGSGLAHRVAPPSRRIYLRTGTGGVTIKAVPPDGDNERTTDSTKSMPQ